MEQFRIIGELYEGHDRATIQPRYIYGVVNFTFPDIINACDDNLADPKTVDFLVIYCELEKYRWAADFRGKWIEVEWLKYSFTPFVPLTQTPTVLVSHFEELKQKMFGNLMLPQRIFSSATY